MDTVNGIKETQIAHAPGLYVTVDFNALVEHLGDFKAIRTMEDLVNTMKKLR